LIAATPRRSRVRQSLTAASEGGALDRIVVRNAYVGYYGGALVSTAKFSVTSFVHFSASATDMTRITPRKAAIRSLAPNMQPVKVSGVAGAAASPSVPARRTRYPLGRSTEWTKLRRIMVAALRDALADVSESTR